MRRISFMEVALLMALMAGCGHPGKPAGEPAQPSPPMTGDTAILQSWPGDYPMDRLERLPADQREQGIGYISDRDIFASVWTAFKPGERVPDIDFVNHLVLFARNTQFYNRISIGKVMVKEGVAEVLAMETKSALPIEDTVAMSLVVIARYGIIGLRTGATVMPIK
ncbi:MAG: hypothetical protein [Olavius algarvensis Delta 4 endosymbiont]|nr:MAG: hypothetical protein [Olavius algarvensis Delta 4 endosymbiont]